MTTLPKRIIGQYEGTQKGPLVICLAGLHGNEPAGVYALNILFYLLGEEPNRNEDFEFKGKIIGLRGNRRALQEGERFINKDMNRQWMPENVERLRNLPYEELDSEDIEIVELAEAIEQQVADYQPERVIVLDIHTTTASGGIFTIVPDSEEAQAIGLQLHAPVVLGMLDGLQGTTMHYYNKPINGIPCTALCFESGQHNDQHSMHNAVSAIIGCMRSVGCVEPSDVEYRHDARLIEHSKNLPRLSRLLYRHPVSPTDNFKMRLGYQNFDRVKKGDLLATDKTGEISWPSDCLVLMPLYQKQGEDGFFLIEEVAV